jgi:predicted Zn finger-like uncharacterized protein
MKFLCPQCKAKYRIADEKLAQRASSRMKCRKCGHVIDIHSATVPDSVRPPGVGADDDEDDDAGDDAPRQDLPRVAAAPAAAGAGAPPRRSATATPQPKRGVAAAPPKRPATAAAAPPRRGGATATAQAVAEKAAPAEEDERPSATAATAAKPAVAKPAAAPPPKNEFEEDAPTRIHDGTALAAAFLAVGDRGTLPGPASAADEWYVGIEGSPIGPLGAAQIREKAREGKATLESLVWRDGFEEWKPLKDFPELVALVGEASRPAAVAVSADVLPAPSPARDAKKAAPLVSEPPSDLLEQIGAAPRKSSSHPAAWAAIIVALAFGVTIGAVLLSKTEKQEVVRYVEVPASAKAEPVAAPGDTPHTIEESTVSGGPAKRVVAQGPKPEPTPAGSAKGGLPSLGGLGTLGGLGGPAPQGTDVAGGGAAGPGGQLDGAAISRVVSNFTSSVRRGCWDQALSARGPDAPSSARVGVTITIAPSGNVDNVTTTGDPKGYPNLAHCIESKVRGWHFPRSSASTTAQVPFVFAAQ